MLLVEPPYLPGMVVSPSNLAIFPTLSPLYSCGWPFYTSPQLQEALSTFHIP